MVRALVIGGWMVVAILGAWLRFEDLAARPFHADEATGARITASRMADGGGFDPKHYHGPLLGDLAIPVFLARGESTWRDMTKETPRLVTAACGLLLVFAPLLWRRRFGDLAALAAGACLAVSPLLVYYSRMFIHEMPLTLFGVLALAALSMPRGRSWPLLAGVALGLMYATKETVAISVLAWAAAALLTAAGDRGIWNRAGLATLCRQWWRPLLVAGLTAAFTAALFYTRLFTRPQGAVDAVRTFFVYETGAGHDKPFLWYLDLLAWPMKSGGRWWFETPILVIALVGFAATFLPDTRDRTVRDTIRFLGYAAAGHFLIYGWIAYKTPWLACLPWAHVCLLAGFSLALLPARRWPQPAALALVALTCVWPLVPQARAATGRFSSDERNPYAYVPTRRDLERLESWLLQVRAVAPDGMFDPVAVVGREYWPLPWYLRALPEVGYWPRVPADLVEAPVVLATVDAAGDVSALLGESHVALPRGLRAEVPVMLYLRNDLWELWMNDGK